MLTLRLQRAGKKNKPEFRIVIAQKTAATSKKFLEILGNYNPRTKQFGIKDENRLKYWVVEQHVQISPTLNNLLVSKNLIDAPKQKAFLIPTKAKAKKAEQETKAQADIEPANGGPSSEEAPAAEEATETATAKPDAKPDSEPALEAEAAPEPQAATDTAPAATPAEPAA